MATRGLWKPTGSHCRSKGTLETWICCNWWVSPAALCILLLLLHPPAALCILLLLLHPPAALCILLLLTASSFSSSLHPPAALCILLCLQSASSCCFLHSPPPALCILHLLSASSDCSLLFASSFFFQLHPLAHFFCSLQPSPFCILLLPISAFSSCFLHPSPALCILLSDHYFSDSPNSFCSFCGTSWRKCYSILPLACLNWNFGYKRYSHWKYTVWVPIKVEIRFHFRKVTEVILHIGIKQGSYGMHIGWVILE